MNKTISLNNTNGYPETIKHNVSEVDDASIITWFDTKFNIWVADISDINEDGSVCCYVAESSSISEEDAIDEAISMYYEMDERNWIYED